MPLSLCFNQNVFQGFSSLQYDMSGGSVKISSLVVVDSDVFKLGKAWWYCVKKGNILLFFFNHGRNPHCWRFMETGDISNEEGDALLSDEKIETRK